MLPLTSRIQSNFNTKYFFLQNRRLGRSGNYRRRAGWIVASDHGSCTIQILFNCFTVEFFVGNERIQIIEFNVANVAVFGVCNWNGSSWLWCSCRRYLWQSNGIYDYFWRCDNWLMNFWKWFILDVIGGIIDFNFYHFRRLDYVDGNWCCDAWGRSRFFWLGFDDYTGKWSIKYSLIFQKLFECLFQYSSLGFPYLCIRNRNLTLNYWNSLSRCHLEPANSLLLLPALVILTADNYLNCALALYDGPEKLRIENYVKASLIIY